MSGKYAGQLVAYQSVGSSALTEISEGEYTFDVKMARYDDSEIYFLVGENLYGAVAASQLTRSYLRTAAFSFPSYQAIQDENPMLGIYRGAVPNDYVWVGMERLKAKMRLRIVNDVAGGTFALQSVQLKRIPALSRYYNTAQDDQAWLFPTVSADAAANSVSFLDYDAVTAGLDGEIVEVGTWYVAENRRGNATTSITEQKYKSIENSPTFNVDGEGTSYATHFVLQGEYTPENSSDKYGVSITFFPGDQNDLNNNFDIVRNTYYDITASIGSLDSEDERIEFTSPPPTMEPLTQHGSGGVSILMGTGIPGATIYVNYAKYSLGVTVLVDEDGNWEDLNWVGDNNIQPQKGEIVEAYQIVPGMLPSEVIEVAVTTLGGGEWGGGDRP